MRRKHCNGNKNRTRSLDITILEMLKKLGGTIEDDEHITCSIVLLIYVLSHTDFY